MIKRFNQYLVTNYPQLWNTRLPHMLCAILVTHLLFYIAGYLHFDSWSKLHEYHNINNMLVQSENIGFSVLASTLLLIVWLVFYLRNNPFKSFYPLKPLYFVAEFAIILVIFLGSITFYKSYASGFCHAINSQTKNINLVDEINAYNLAYGLLPSKMHHYNPYYSCDSIEYIDSLQSLREEYQNIYLDEEDGLVKRTYMDDTLEDSVSKAIGIFFKRRHVQTNYSFVYFCYKQCDVLDTLTYNRREISGLIQQWLTTGNRKQVAATLKQFDAMCKKYRIDHHINFDEYAGLVFADKNLRPIQYINDGYSDVIDETTVVTSVHTPGPVNANTDNIAYDQLNTALNNIEHVRRGQQLEPEFWLANLLVALNLAIFLFTFRLMPIRVWFTAIAAHLALPILVTMLMFIMLGGMNDDILALHFLLFMFIVAYILYFALRDKMKKTAGVMLVWVTWWLLYAGLIVYAILLHIYEPQRIEDTTGAYTYTSNPTYDFLKEHATAIGAAYMLFTFLYIAFVLTRHYRKWMALPEE